MHRDFIARPRPQLALATALAALVVAALGGISPAHAAAARSCADANLPSPNGYIIGMRVTNVSCKTGRNVALAFFRCRHKKGKTGRCTDKVLGYSCREGKRVSTAVELDATVTCTRGARKVVHTYQQNL